MPVYNSKQKIKSGLPLGGIGAGKLEITPYGTIDYISCQNNWNSPIFNRSNKEKGKAQGLIGFNFALYANMKAAHVCKVLQTEKVGDFKNIKQIDFDGNFPYARLEYRDNNLPVEISLCAQSLFIPGDVKNSGLPAVIFEFEVTNKVHKEIEAGLMFSARNTVSRHSVGRMNLLKKEHDLLGILMRQTSPLAHDETAGEIFFGIPRQAGRLSYLTGWNMQRHNFVFEEDIGYEALEFFEENGRLPNKVWKQPVQSQSVELAGALAVNFRLKPGQTKKIPLIYSWFFSKHHQGHFYERNFKSARKVAGYVSRNKEDLQGKTAVFKSIMDGMELPAWFNDALMNNLYPLVSASWLTRRGDFAMYEAPLICPLMGTLDVYFYASTAIGLLFPSLDRKALLLFRKHIRRSGYVPHDLGLDRIDLPSNGTTMPLWKDLNSKFILMAYRAYEQSGDIKFLKEMYPALKKALEFSLSLDKNGDGLPDNEGFDTTFDTWDFKGLNSYNGGIFLVSLIVFKKMAELLNDNRSAKRAVQLYVKGMKNFESLLWNGKFYKTAKHKNGDYDSCMVAQLAGQWYAYLLGLGRMFPEEHVKSAIRCIFKLNDKGSPFGAVNSIYQDGKKDLNSYHSQNIWPGVCYSFAALAIYEGFVKEGLNLTKKVWDVLAHKNKNPWNQPDVIIAKDGSYGFGDYYMRNCVIWAVLLALGTQDKKVSDGITRIRSLVDSSPIVF